MGLRIDLISARDRPSWVFMGVAPVLVRSILGSYLVTWKLGFLMGNNNVLNAASL